MKLPTDNNEVSHHKMVEAVTQRVDMLMTVNTYMGKGYIRTKNPYSIQYSMFSKIFSKIFVWMSIFRKQKRWYGIGMNGPYPNSILKIDDTPIPHPPLNKMKSFHYLGVWSDYNDIHVGKTELSHWMNSAKCTFAENRKMLTSRHIQLKTRVSLLNSLVRSRLTYGYHAWRPTTTEFVKISTIYGRFICSMVINGYKKLTHLIHQQRHLRYPTEAMS